MINVIVRKMKGLLLDPVRTFQQSRTDEPGTVFTYFIVLLAVNAILSALVSAIDSQNMPALPGIPGIPIPVLEFFAVLVAGFILTLIFAAWVHLWVYLLGGRKGIMQTLKAIIYGETPRLLLGWIPVIGFVFTLWALVLGILGIRELQELSTGKAILAMAIAILIPLALILIAYAYFTIGSATIVQVPPAMNPYPAGV